MTARAASPPPLPTFITITQAAEHLGLTTRSVQRLLARGDLHRVYPMGKRAMLRSAEVVAWAANVDQPKPRKRGRPPKARPAQ